LISGGSEDIQVEKKRKNKKSGSGNDLKDFTDSISQFKKSKITFDKGGIWKFISPPAKDVAGKKY
jgi:hypothetical protein